MIPKIGKLICRYGTSAYIGYLIAPYYNWPGIIIIGIFAIFLIELTRYEAVETYKEKTGR